jgi:hypothetical protein
MTVQTLHMTPNQTLGSRVVELKPGTWRLEIPAGIKGSYRLAQLDDYRLLPRRSFPWQPPLTLQLRARASSPDLPGTWGFGLWNDPFSLSLGLGGAAQRFPALPNAAWFFYASPPNYLSFRDDLPAQGFLAATFRSPSYPAPLLFMASFLIPLLLIPPVGSLARKLICRLIQQDAGQINVDVVSWHHYALEWRQGSVCFWVDGHLCLETNVLPNGPLSLVLWIDNQYAALPPGGRLAYGFLPNPQPAWIELADIAVVR